MDFLKLTVHPLSVEDVIKLVEDSSCGAIDIFVGTTRDEFEGRKVVTLEYEAYENMAEKEMKKICNKCRSRLNIQNIAIYHRLGLVPVKEASIIIAVSSKHRKEAIEAVSFLIDSVKSSVPIWKKEYYADNKPEWKGNSECFWLNNKILENGTSKMEKVGDITYIKQEGMDEEFTSEEISYENDKNSVTDDGIDHKVIQIVASKDEMDRRIKAFQEKKREELNVLNIQEFCQKEGLKDDYNSCARTDAVILRSKGSISHLKYTKVFNEWGPLIASEDYSGFMASAKSSLGSDISTQIDHPKCVEDASFDSQSNSTGLPEGIQERLSNMEDHLRLGIGGGKMHSSVYARIKALEDRILFLEGMSPEYFSVKVTPYRSPIKIKEEKATDDDMTLDDVDARIYALRKKLKSRQLGIDL